MSREERKRQAKRDARASSRQNALMMKAAHQLEISQANIEQLQSRNDFWRNLLVASAFARGLGNERPISVVIEECVPALVGLNKPQVPGQVPT